MEGWEALQRGHRGSRSVKLEGGHSLEAARRHDANEAPGRGSPGQAGASCRAAPQEPLCIHNPFNDYESEEEEALKFWRSSACACRRANQEHHQLLPGAGPGCDSSRASRQHRGASHRRSKPTAGPAWLSSTELDRSGAMLPGRDNSVRT